MSKLCVKHSGKARGDFEAYSEDRIYNDYKLIGMKLKKHGNGKYTKTYQAKLEMATGILKLIGVGNILTVREDISIKNGIMTVVVKTPRELQKVADVKETYQCRQAGSNVEYAVKLEGTVKVNAMIRNMAKELYTNARIGEIKHGIENSAPPDLGGVVIPQ